MLRVAELLCPGLLPSAVALVGIVGSLWAIFSKPAAGLLAAGGCVSGVGVGDESGATDSSASR